MSGIEPLIAAATAAAPAASTVATAATIGGSIVSGLGQIQAGRAANISSKFQAAQAQQQAGQQRAAGQRAAIEERRKTDIALSRGQAVAAASGGGALDPTVLKLMGGVAQQGEYNALSALFESEEAARGLELGAAAKRMEGKQAKKAGMIGGISTIAGGIGQGLYQKYGTPSTAMPSETYGGEAFASSGLPWKKAGNVKPSWMN